jgi:hypothetical protein
MKLPTMRTPVRRCLGAAGFSCRMLAKHSQDARLVELGVRFEAGRTELAAAQRRLVEAEDNLTLMRVDVKFEDHSSDRFLRRLLARIEAEDGRKGGRLCKVLLPEGLGDITRRRNAAQVERMRGLEARLAAIQDWADAATLAVDLAGHRGRYESALDVRLAAERLVVTERANRNAAKERFLDLYAEIAAQIRSIFPRDKDMQDLFFDELEPASRRYAGEPGDDLPEEPVDDDAAA